MKYILSFIFILSISPLYTGPNCMDNSEHLTRPYDTKEMHIIGCNCDCTIIKNDYCIECSHLQNAHPLIDIKPKKINYSVKKYSKIYTPETPQDTLKKLAAQYLLNE